MVAARLLSPCAADHTGNPTQPIAFHSIKHIAHNPKVSNRSHPNYASYSSPHSA